MNMQTEKQLVSSRLNNELRKREKGSEKKPNSVTYECVWIFMSSPTLAWDRPQENTIRQTTMTSQQQYPFFRVATDEAFSDGRTSKQTPPYHVTGRARKQHMVERTTFFWRGATWRLIHSYGDGKSLKPDSVAWRRPTASSLSVSQTKHFSTEGFRYKIACWYSPRPHTWGCISEHVLCVSS